LPAEVHAKAESVHKNAVPIAASSPSCEVSMLGSRIVFAEEPL